MYCIDTCSLSLWCMKHPYSFDVFPSVWRNLSNVAKEGLVVSPREVLRELEKCDVELHKWAKENISFYNLDYEQQKIVADIMARFPNLVDIDKPTPVADPFVIALAKSEKRTVITEERYVNLSGPKSKPKIPNVCEALQVKCIPLLDFFKEQGWKF